MKRRRGPWKTMKLMWRLAGIDLIRKKREKAIADYEHSYQFSGSYYEKMFREGLELERRYKSDDESAILPPF